MQIFQDTLVIETRGAGTLEITDRVAAVVSRSRLKIGTVSVFCQHTSCSLVLMENADPTARRDLERWLDRLVPENDPDFVHTFEGPDDMPSHIKMALTRSSETIPFRDGRLLTGTWQGIFLWEHRVAPHRRRLVITLMGE
jgi:secondary thiamine-phosphate synthase enzyme